MYILFYKNCLIIYVITYPFSNVCILCVKFNLLAIKASTSKFPQRNFTWFLVHWLLEQSEILNRHHNNHAIILQNWILNQERVLHWSWYMCVKGPIEIIHYMQIAVIANLEIKRNQHEGTKFLILHRRIIVTLRSVISKFNCIYIALKRQLYHMAHISLL